MTRMFRFNLRGTVSLQNNRDPTFLLKSKNSIYCVHREVTLAKGVHQGTTKSCILGFRYKEHAKCMQEVLNSYQSRGCIIDGLVDGGIMSIDDSLQGRPVSKLDIHPYPLEEIEKECLMNYMDLWLVADVRKLLREGEGEYDCDWRLDVYDYMTVEPPHRSYINHQFERLLRF